MRVSLQQHSLVSVHGGKVVPWEGRDDSSPERGPEKHESFSKKELDRCTGDKRVKD